MSHFRPFLTNESGTERLFTRTTFPVVSCVKTTLMKNEPVVTYNHMEEDDAGRTVYPEAQAKESLPISLYMLLVVDAILVSAIVFLTFKVIF